MFTVVVVSVLRLFDPYVSVDIDGLLIGRTQTRPRTRAPIWNEEITARVHCAENINFTVFRRAALPPDEFVANYNVPFEDVVGETTSDFWVMSEI